MGNGTVTESRRSGVLNILLIDQDSGNAALIEEMLLQSRHLVCHLTWVESVQTGIDFLRQNEIDAVLLGVKAPEASGLEGFYKIHERMAALPVVILADAVDENLGIRAVQDGAQDYLVKQELNAALLVRALQYAVDRARLKTTNDELIDIITHELRSPMTVIREGVLQVLDGLHGDVSDAQKTFLSLSMTNIDRLTQLINNLRETVKIETSGLQIKKGLFDIVKLTEIICAGFKIALATKNLAVQTRFEPQSIEVYGDRTKISQAIANLVSNAIKFTQKGDITISILEKEKCVEWSIQDSGAGITPENLPRVYDKYAQFDITNVPGEKGIGLGLFIVRAVVELHGGRIQLESEAGKGTLARFSLPRYTRLELLKDYLGLSMPRAARRGGHVSLLILSLIEADRIRAEFPEEKVVLILKNMEYVIRKNLRNAAGDTALFDEKTLEVYVLCHDCSPEGALSVTVRLGQAVRDYLAGEELSDKIKWHFGRATFPDDAATDDELIRKARA